MCKNICSLIAFVIYLNLNSCTLTGFIVGNSIDNSKPDSLIYDITRIEKIEPESDVIVLLKNGECIDGIFKEIETKVPEKSQFSELVKINKNSMDAPIPIPGDTIQIKLKNNEIVKCKLLGYDYNLIWVYLIDKKITGKASASQIPALRSMQGRKIPIENINSLIDSGKIHTYSNVVLEVNDEKKLINFSKINLVKFYPGKNSKYYSLLVGATIDAALLLIITWELNQSMKDFKLKFN